MEPTAIPPLVVALDDADSPADVVDALALGHFAAGVEPASCTARLARVRRDAELLPVGAIATWTVEEPGRHVNLARGEGWTCRSTRWSDGAGEVTVTAVNAELARAVLAEATLDATDPEGCTDETAVVSFWYDRERCGPRTLERELSVASWETIRRNYATEAAVAFDTVMLLTPDQLSGRILLAHGPAGTGKTTAIRALAHAWRSWCRLHVVVDPERFFSDPGYLLRVCLGDDDNDVDRQWRLIVLEDCDELIRSDAKRGSGQSLARLLNLTDGLLGQGLDILVAITTNEPLERLHPAIVRPGRCLAEIEVGPLSRAEAAAWLGATVATPNGATLAELFTLRGETAKTTSKAPTALIGQYL